MELSDNIYERIISEDDSGLNQVRLTVNEFRGVEYLHLRKYYLDFSGEWYPSDKGISIALEIESSKELLIGLAEILSLAESKELLEEYFGDIIRKVYMES